MAPMRTHLMLLLAGLMTFGVMAPSALAQDADDDVQMDLEDELDDEKKSRHDVLVYGRAMVWLPELSGDVLMENNLGLSTVLDFDSVLGVGDMQTEAAWEITLRFDRHEFRFSGFTFGSSSTETTNIAVDFGDLTFNIGDVIGTDFDATNLKLLHGFAPFSFHKNGFRLGLLLGINFYDLDIEVTDVAGLASESISEQIPLPVIGGFVEIPLWQFLLSGEISGLALTINNVDAFFLDASVSLTWRPLPLVGIFAGYRNINAEIQTGDFDVEAQLQGMFFGGEIRF